MNDIVKIIALVALLGVALASVVSMPDRMTTVVELPDSGNMQPSNIIAPGPQQSPVPQPAPVKFADHTPTQDTKTGGWC